VDTVFTAVAGEETMAAVKYRKHSTLHTRKEYVVNDKEPWMIVVQAMSDMSKRSKTAVIRSIVCI